MCPITKEGCVSNCDWYSLLFEDKKEKKKYYGCVVQKIAFELDAIKFDTENLADISFNTQSIDINTSN